MEKIIKFNPSSKSVDNTSKFVNSVTKAFKGFKITMNHNCIFEDCCYEYDIKCIHTGNALLVNLWKGSLHGHFNITNADGCIFYFRKEIPTSSIFGFTSSNTLVVYFDNTQASLKWILNRAKEFMDKVDKVNNPGTKQDCVKGYYILHEGRVVVALKDSVITDYKVESPDIEFSSVSAMFHEYFVEHNYNDKCFVKILTVGREDFGMCKAKKIYYIGYDHDGNELLLVCDSNGIRQTTKDELKPYMLKEYLDD